MKEKLNTYKHFTRTIINLIFISFVLTLFGCGSGGDGTISDATDGAIDGVTISSISLQSSLESGTLLAQGGTTTVTATVRKSDGTLADDGTEVMFAASSGTISESALTQSGKAVATYNAAAAGGVVNITANTSDITSDVFNLTVASGPASTISLVSSSPERLALMGSGNVETGTFIFSVKDAGGNPVSDGQTVRFDLKSTTGGGEFLSANSATTVSGEVSVTLTSGSVPGVATVTASTSNDSATISTEARITIGYGKTDQNHVGLAVNNLNVPGLVEFGIENTITAYIADRFSNPVPANTPVYFASDCGIVSLTDNDGISSNLTNQFGIASAISITANPTDDLCTMIVWTEGEEAYTDLNGNGVYDEGVDIAQNIGEPYIDANDNGSYDKDSETYFDVNHDGKYDPADNVWNSNTFVWTSKKVRWSDKTALPIIKVKDSNNNENNIDINADDSKAFTITVADKNDNPLPAGTTFSVTTTCSDGKLSGDTSVTLEDAIYAGTGTTLFHVNLLNENTGTSDQKCSLQVDVSATPNGAATSSVDVTLKAPTP